jgi:hypothetical protein
MSDEEIDNYVLNYVSKLNTGFSENFAISEVLEKQLGPELSSKLKKYSPELIKSLLASGFDLSLLTVENVDDFVNNFKTSIENNPNAVVSVPVSLQLDLNEKILSGKDIAKSD